MRTFNLHYPLTPETQPEQIAIHAYQTFHHWKALQISASGRPKPLTRRLEFHNHLPVSTGIYRFHCSSTLRLVDSMQDMLMQFGFTLRGMRRRHARGESADDGKVEYLEGIYQAWVDYLGEMWEFLRTRGMRESSAVVVREAAGYVEVTEEVAAFVRDMDFHGVGFLSEEWDGEAREWTEGMLREEEWLGEGGWRERFCGILQGRDDLLFF